MEILRRSLLQSGALHERAQRANLLLRQCQLCPRRCRVNRLENEKGFCVTGRLARVASYGPHFGEEQPLVGRHGSGTIFFASCNLRCCFCQNYEISHDQSDSVEIDGDDLASIMLELQNRGCHNINFVSPSHILPTILEALPKALESGLHIPLVYNCSGYEAPEALALLDGIVDIYLTDFKFWQPASGDAYLRAADYPEVAREAVKIMHRHVGDLMIDNRGLAVRGLLIRHLLMPGGFDETAAILDYIANQVSMTTYINIMDQYRPCGTYRDHPELAHPVGPDHHRRALALAERTGLTRIDQRDLGSLLRRLGIT